MAPSPESGYNSNIMYHIRINDSPVSLEIAPYHEGWPTPSLEELYPPRESHLILSYGVFFQLFVKLTNMFVVVCI